MLGLDLLAANLNTSIETLVLFSLLVAGMIWFSFDFVKGVMLNFLTFLVAFIAGYALDTYTSATVYYGGFLIVTFIYLIILSFTLWSISQVASKGGII